MFMPERWLQRPDAPLFTYGLGYRSCTGISLASRLLYLFFIRRLRRLRYAKGVAKSTPILSMVARAVRI